MIAYENHDRLFRYCWLLLKQIKQLTVLVVRERERERYRDRQTEWQTNSHDNGSAKHGRVAKIPAKCRLAPTVRHGQGSGDEFLIVYAVKICKQCLQTASASGGLRPPGRAPIPNWEIPWVIARPNENSWRPQWTNEQADRKHWLQGEYVGYMSVGL